MLKTKSKTLYALLFVSCLCVLLLRASHAGKDLCANEDFIRDMLAAGERGVAVAQAGIAGCYHRGVGVPQSDLQAAKWYEKSAQQGDANSQYLMGWFYDTGKGVKKDAVQAFKWHHLAAEQGDRASQLFVGMAYLDGKGVGQNSASAARWIEKSAHRGVPNAQSVLAGMYLAGQGVAQNSKEAYFWSILAARSGDKVRITIRDQIKEELTSEEIIHVQGRAQAWQPLPDMTPP